METTFLEDVTANQANRAILSRWQRLGLPNSWLVAGCLFQTIWNIKSSRQAGENIKDYDIFYFDTGDLTKESEEQAQRHVDSVLMDLGITVEVANQARVHLWYPDFFGQPYTPLSSAEEGIKRFLVKETCVGVRPRECHAPYGLAGVYAGTLTANPMVPQTDLFVRKVASYRQRWPWLTVNEREVEHGA
ncbi:nucleotidyltransferase family protein [Paucibacter sp. TC2R-5]|uniref:nucleotidyltransferase family protein n=1 Tax=Paucibacter sp. TC2R-5 TaxID=2893555 RepID=UPI0021E4A65E|nr:nucleotidyltransferase family protein [Paucibacter sp. TC2R-5]MCV2360042.1 nucleotidyltransferase family protein [Paucibacter sp. TC2R-5]